MRIGYSSFSSCGRGLIEGEYTRRTHDQKGERKVCRAFRENRPLVRNIYDAFGSEEAAPAGGVFQASRAEEVKICRRRDLTGFRRRRKSAEPLLHRHVRPGALLLTLLARA